MIKRSTLIGSMFVQDRERAVDEITQCMRMADGNVSKAAQLLCIDRCHLYRLLRKANLLPVIAEMRNKHRLARIRDAEWLRKTMLECSEKDHGNS